jgi:hypothetical protein
MAEIQSQISLKRDVLEELNKTGYMDQMKAQLRARVIEAMEAKKKKQYGAASKYMRQSEISNPITKKVVGHEDGLLCAEIMREFMQFYKMNLSMKIFVPEMSLSEDFPKSRTEMERELGLKAS